MADSYTAINEDANQPYPHSSNLMQHENWPTDADMQNMLAARISCLRSNTTMSVVSHSPRCSHEDIKIF